MLTIRLLAGLAIFIGAPALLALIAWQETRPPTREDFRQAAATYEKWRAAADESAHLDSLVGLCQSARRVDRIASGLRDSDRAVAQLDIALIGATRRVAAQCDEHRVPSRYRLDEMKSVGRRNTADRLVGVDIR